MIRQKQFRISFVITEETLRETLDAVKVFAVDAVGLMEDILTDTGIEYGELDAAEENV